MSDVFLRARIALSTAGHEVLAQELWDEVQSLLGKAAELQKSLEWEEVQTECMCGRIFTSVEDNPERCGVPICPYCVRGPGMQGEAKLVARELLHKSYAYGFASFHDFSHIAKSLGCDARHIYDPNTERGGMAEYSTKVGNGMIEFHHSKPGFARVPVEMLDLLKRECGFNT